MNARIQFLVGLALLVLFSAAPAHANHTDRGASGNGVVDSDCVADIQTDPACVQFDQQTLTTAQWRSYSLGSDGTTAVLDNDFELFMVPTTGPVTFQLTGPNVAFGSFMCGEDGDFTAIQSGMLASLNGFCNTFADPSAILNPNPATPDGSNKVLFNFINSSNLPAEWVFYTTFGDGSIVPNDTTPMPEPGSLVLLSMGLIAVFGGLRRRSKGAATA